MTRTPQLARFGRCVALLASVLGCSAQEVWLGSAQTAERDLSSCLSGGCATRQGVARMLDERDAAECAQTPAGRLEVMWYRELASVIGNEPSGKPACLSLGHCELSAQSVAIVHASDDTLWLAGKFSIVSPDGSDDPSAGVWLGHYSATGIPLDQLSVEFERLYTGEQLTYTVSLAAGEAGSVWLGVYEDLGKEGFTEAQISRRIFHYASDLRLMAEPLQLTGQRRGAYASMWLARGSGDVLAVGSAKRVALLEAGRPRWVQSIDDEVQAIAVDARRQVAVLSNDPESATPHDRARRYDEHGQLQWELVLPAMTQPFLQSGSEGSVLRAGMHEAVSEGDDVAPPIIAPVLHRISNQGESLALVRLGWPKLAPIVDSAWNRTTPMTVDANGHIWLAGGSYFPRAVPGAEPPQGGIELPYGQFVHELPPDARWCRPYSVPSLGELLQLAPGPDGGLYFLSEASFGLLRPTM